MARPRTVAILAVRNESPYMRICLEHLAAGGVRCVVLDNESDDRTVAISQEFRPNPVLAVERVPYPGHYDLEALLAAKDALLRSIDADWIIHHDADEIMQSNRPGESLADAIARVDAAGYNAIDFEEFVFLHEDDVVDYAGRDYYREMRHYYCHRPVGGHPRLVRAFHHTAHGSLARFGGHRPGGRGLKIFPERMVLRHYICLSKDHAVRKYCGRVFSEKALRRGWHRNRARIRAASLSSPGPAKLERLGDDPLRLDASRPRSEHFWLWGDLRWLLLRRLRRLGRMVVRRLRAPGT